MADQISPEDQKRMDRVYKRELELIKQGQDPETAHAVAVAEETVKENKSYDKTKKPNTNNSIRKSFGAKGFSLSSSDKVFSLER